MKRELLLPFLFFRLNPGSCHDYLFFKFEQPSKAARGCKTGAQFRKKIAKMCDFFYLRSRKQRRFGCQNLKKQIQLERRGMQDLKKRDTTR